MVPKVHLVVPDGQRLQKRVAANVRTISSNGHAASIRTNHSVSSRFPRAKISDAGARGPYVDVGVHSGPRYLVSPLCSTQC